MDALEGWEPLDGADIVVTPIAPTAAPVAGSAEVVPDGDGKAVCPGCGGRFKVTADGKITGQHKCPGVRTVSGGSKSPTRRAGKGKLDLPPETVRELMRALIGAGAEYAAVGVVARYVPMAAGDVPDEVVNLPDDKAMIDPVLNAAWPQIPKKAQKVITRIADEKDLLAAAFLWWEWSRDLRRFAEEAHRLAQQQGVGLSVVPPFMMPATEGAPDEPTFTPFVSQAGGGGPEPFQPVNP